MNKYTVTDTSIRAKLIDLRMLTGQPDLIKSCHKNGSFECEFFIIQAWQQAPKRYELVAREDHKEYYQKLVEKIRSML